MLKSKSEIGKMDKRITIIQKDVSTNEFNGETWSYILYKIVWAAEDAGLSYGTEAVQADKTTATRRTSFVVRYDAGINEEMRIVYGSKVYDIVSVKLPDANRDRFLKLDCDYLEGEIWT